MKGVVEEGEGVWRERREAGPGRDRAVAHFRGGEEYISKNVFAFANRLIKSGAD